ncbi:HLA class II histocompatibility antigen, DP alpha 1 chain-like [Ascaphus truei]|uniref:HLA class II histocompatibility antigen, DP alpha 1 chain-like n=1 Tax=Ascaphus truei TaxID=8439 RepID=UPI003F5AD0F3
MAVPMFLLFVLMLQGSQAVKVDYFDFGAGFYQSHKPTGEFLFDFEENELFHVDLDTKTVVWVLPGLEEHTGFDVQGALQNINVLKYNLDVMIKNSNRTAATNVPPVVTVYTENPVVLGEPNTLICFIRNIFPPVMNTTWLKNGEKISEGVRETIFLPSQDHSFRKFLYLVFIPDAQDIYTCEVEHWGLDRPSQIMWRAEAPSPLSETSQKLVCAVGLAVGIIGIIIGAVLTIKGMKQSAAQGRGKR